MELADPTIAMQVKPYGGVQPINPFEMMNQFANTQRTMIEARTAQQMLAARQRAGQIMSQAPDLQTGIKALYSDPLTAGFAADLAQTYQGVSTSQTEQAGSQQTQAQSALNALMKTIGTTALSDPTGKMTHDAVEAQLGTFSPTARVAAQNAWVALRKSLFDGLDPNDPNWQQEYKKRAAGVALAGSGDVETVRSLTGAVAPSVEMQPNAAAGGANQPLVKGSPDLVSPPTAQFVGAPEGKVPSSLTPDIRASQEAMGVQEADTSKAMSEAAEVAPIQERNIGLMENAMKVVQTGGGAVGRSALAQTGQMLQQLGFPIPQEVVSEIAAGKDGEIDGLPASQVIKNGLRSLALGNLKTDQSGLGKAYLFEIQSAIDSLDNNSDPKTIQTILDKVRYATELQNDRSHVYFNDYYKARQAGEVGPNSFQDYYAHHNLDAFNAAFEKAHPGVIGEKLPQAKATAKKKLSDQEQDDLINSVLGTP